MTIVEENYQKYCNRSSDINEHLPTLSRYASECEHVTEMGVREVVSTWAFLDGKPKRLISYDIYTAAGIALAEQGAVEAGVDFTFIEKNVLDVTIEETDLLFIDTWHKYGQLIQELDLHAGSVRKYIILHDTTKYATEDEGHWHGKYQDERTEGMSKRGLWTAVEEFLQANPEWSIKERYTNNNGLTVLQRNERTT